MTEHLGRLLAETSVVPASEDTEVSSAPDDPVILDIARLDAWDEGVRGVTGCA